MAQHGIIRYGRQLIQYVFRGSRITCPTDGAISSEAFGDNAVAGAFSVALGGATQATGTRAVNIGSSSGVSDVADGGTGIGCSVNAAAHAIAIGDSAVADNPNTCIIGSEDAGKGINTIGVMNGPDISPLQASADLTQIGADNKTGLYIACRIGGVVVQRQVVFDGVTGVMSIVP